MMFVSGLKRVVEILPENLRREVYWYNNRLRRSGRISVWKLEGMPVPPPHQYKQSVVEEIVKRYKYKNFIETGTFMGHMIEAQRKNFKALFSVELDHTLFTKAKQYFSNYNHIKIIEGDSAKQLAAILDELNADSIIFWLDGHYCGENTGMGEKECPIYEELETIFKRPLKEKYILIDDARCFNGRNDYPTLEELRNFISVKDQNLHMNIINDIIHIS